MLVLDEGNAIDERDMLELQADGDSGNESGGSGRLHTDNGEGMDGRQQTGAGGTVQSDTSTGSGVPHGAEEGDDLPFAAFARGSEGAAVRDTVAAGPAARRPKAELPADNTAADTQQQPRLQAQQQKPQPQKQHQLQGQQHKPKPQKQATAKDDSIRQEHAANVGDRDAAGDPRTGGSGASSELAAEAAGAVAEKPGKGSSPTKSGPVGSGATLRSAPDGSSTAGSGVAEHAAAASDDGADFGGITATGGNDQEALAAQVAAEKRADPVRAAAADESAAAAARDEQAAGQATGDATGTDGGANSKQGPQTASSNPAAAARPRPKPKQRSAADAAAVVLGKLSRLDRTVTLTPSRHSPANGSKCDHQTWPCMNAPSCRCSHRRPRWLFTNGALTPCTCERSNSSSSPVGETTSYLFQPLLQPWPVFTVLSARPS